WVPAMVLAKPPVARPAALVTEAGWVMVLPDPVAASTTPRPGIALPKPSRAVTVTAVVSGAPAEAVIVPGVIVTVDCEAFTAPGLAVAMKFTGEPAAVARADCVLSPAEVAVPRCHDVVAMPCALVSDVTGSTLPR